MGDWTRLLPALSAPDRRRVETGIAEADVHVRPLLRPMDTYFWATSVTRTPEWAATKAWPGELRRRAALAVHLKANNSSIPSALNDVVRSLADGVHDWTRADLLWSLEVAGQGHGYDNGAHLELPAMIAVRLAPADLADLAPALSALFDEIAEDYFMAAGPRRRVAMLIGGALDRATGRRVPSWLLHHGDEFGPSYAPVWVTSSPRRACPSC
ncbi:hypothetical protein [Micromonospora sp. WMMD1274]|uniref:hypothetical protein n=1 Tax=Micromonospora sp. WMMD1274 TaxID=3404116 RepID=UPI003B933A47